MNLYADNIIDHYKHPHGKKELTEPTVEHHEVNVSCGDAVYVQLRIEGDVIKDFGWSGNGCAVSQAGMSILSEEISGKTEAEVNSWTKDDILKLLGIPIGPRRAKCALLCLHTVKNALHKLHGEEEQEWFETVGELD